LSGCQLVVSDAHEGLKSAIAQVLGCPWQRCTVHVLREALGHARREQQPMLAALLARGRGRLNREIGRRTDVVGIFLDDRSLIRLATISWIEQNDEWLVGRRYLSLDSLAPLLEEQHDNDVDKEALELTAARAADDGVAVWTDLRNAAGRLGVLTSASSSKA